MIQLRECRTAQEVRDTYAATSARFKALKAPPPKISPSSPEAKAELISILERAPPPLVNPIAPVRSRILHIQAVVAKDYGVSMNDLTSQRRTSNVVQPRQVAMYLCRVHTKQSLPEIGRRFGGRDHTTVLHACRKIEAKIANNPEFFDRVTSIESLLGF